MNEDNKALVLIVDDVSKNLQVLAAVLYQEGYEIAMADNGKMAIEMLAEMTPELILLDIMMPEMDGFEVCEKIKSQEKLSSIPIIFLTAKNETESILKGFEIGAADYVTKPFNSAELLSRVRTHIELSQKRKALLLMNEGLEKLVKERTSELEIANERLQDLDKAKSYLLNLLSHELNTPINGIKGFAQLLKDTLKGTEDEELVDSIIESSLRLKKFADISMLITSLKSNKYKMKFQPYDINSILNETIFRYKDKFEEKQLTLKNDFGNEENILEIDPHLISKCFELVVENAYKYNSQNGEVSIIVKDNDNLLTITVKNTGNGFPKEYLDEPFSMFKSDEIMHHQDGYGLGLTTVKLIMESHSGSIEINNYDGGAYVVLKLSKKAN